MREALGDGYVEALRKAWVDVPDTADFVVYWWAQAASKVEEGKARRMGLITTNSLTMVFNRSVVQTYLESGVVLTYAIPDHLPRGRFTPQPLKFSKQRIVLNLRSVLPEEFSGSLTHIANQSP
jgi:hypothetical protein